MSPEAAQHLLNGNAAPESVDQGASPPPELAMTSALFVAVITLLIWSTLAVSVVSLSTIPPLLTTAIGLAGGGLIGIPWIRWRQLKARIVIVGSLSMFGYHALYFLSLQWADPVAANLLHYLWPLLIILLGPMMLPGHRLSRFHVAAGGFGFLGAVACMSSGPAFLSSSWPGFLLAGTSALIWAYYSVWSRRWQDVPTSTVALYCFLAGVASLLTYVVMSLSGMAALPPVGSALRDIAPRQWLVLLYLIAGPLGGTFYMWDYAIKRGRPSQIAILAYAVPVASTLFVSLYLGRGLDMRSLFGAVMVSAAVALGNRGERKGITSE